MLVDYNTCTCTMYNTVTCTYMYIHVHVVRLHTYSVYFNTCI